MIAELGVFALIIALVFAVMLVLVPGIGIHTQNESWIAAAPLYAVGQFVAIALAYLCLTYCFLTNDFSVAYVMANSSLLLPWFYKICAVWGGHEGSMLLWTAILSFWMLAVTCFSRSLEVAFRARILVVLAALSVGFILFLLSTSNPFLRQFAVIKTMGRDLNPLLQDPGFLFHPPVLYMGYVGFSVAFAFAIAALWAGKIETSWSKWARPWTLAAWCFLTLGITLGSWWAYRELGWGGWWFWDPVENASFMPWLAGTALLHSLAVSEKRHQFIAWTLLLCITTFSLSLLGTFLVRSGVLTSVHAFAVDPQRGLYILSFLMVVVGGSFTLFAFRAQTIKAHYHPRFISRESFLLLNNVLLIVAMLTVLLGTTYPLIIDGLGLGKLSVGTPYFNSLFFPLAMALLAILGVGVHLKWQGDNWQRLKGMFFSLVAISLGSGFILWMFAPFVTLTLLMSLIMAFWVIFSTLQLMWQRWKTKLDWTQGFIGMLCAHVGLAIAIIGMAVSSTYGLEANLVFSPDAPIQFAGYTFRFINESALNEANYTGARAHFSVAKGQQRIDLYPEKRIYKVGKMVMTDSAIDVNPFRDLYIALGEPMPPSSWAVRVYMKPLVRWIWYGGFMIFFGGFMALTDKRYYRKRTLASTILQDAPL